jgi:hypothetical protein
MNNQPKPKKINVRRKTTAQLMDKRRPVPSDSRVRKAPVSQNEIMRTRNPVFSSSRSGADIVIRHRELIRDIPGSVGFAVTQVPVNPGLSTSFPWLSFVASLYESYILEDLKYEFKTTAPTSTTGSVMSAVDYDASDAAPADKIQLASYQGYARSSTWDSFSQVSPKEALHKQKTYYVRSGALSANQDIKLYDVGNFFIATQGQSNTDMVGELYVSYTVRLITPQLGNIAVGLSKSSKIVTGLAITISAGSSAPLVPTGLTASGSVTLTATAPFDCLISNNGISTVGTPAPVSTGSTCTVQNEVTFGVASASPARSYLYSAELSFKTGETFVFSPGPGVTWTNNTCSIAQFNTLVL